jgi:hypothetical protein
VGLDVYVGPLSRYYTGGWETVVQQYAREQGLELRFATPEGEIENRFEDAPSADEVREGIDAWQRAVGDALGVTLEWNESEEAPWFTDKPDWIGFGALQLLAAYDDRDELKQPKKHATEWQDDKVWKKATKSFEQGEDVRYPHLYLPELWLPVMFERPFRGPDLGGDYIAIGSLPRLAHELRALASRTVGDDRQALTAWRESPDVDDSFEAAARFGLAIFLELAEHGVEHRLPMKLDY